MNLKVRTIREEDVEELSEFWYDLASMHEDIMEGYDLAEEPKVKWREFVKKGMERDGMVTFVAEEDDEIVGFVNVVMRKRASFFEYKEMGMILDLYVKKEKRRQGIGKKLVDISESWIRSKGVEIAVLTVAPVNEDAVGFWDDMRYDTYLQKRRKEL